MIADALDALEARIAVNTFSRIRFSVFVSPSSALIALNVVMPFIFPINISSSSKAIS